jgi:2-oxoglutarate dehydrogenase complex dehydrogenase (E1) component-like enzyme
MGHPDVDGLNTGYAALLLEQYLDNPGAVPEEWRDLFESEPEVLLQRHPGLARLLERAAADGDGHAAPVATPQPAPAPEPAPAPAVTEEDKELLGGIAAAMSLIKAIRMHGHLAARLDPLGSEPPGDPALEPERLIPKLTPELQARIPASLLRLQVEGDTLADALPRLLETYTGSIAYEIEHISDHESGSGCGRRSSRAATGARSPATSGGGCSGGSARWRGWSATCGAPSSGRSSSPSKAST